MSVKEQAIFLRRLKVDGSLQTAYVGLAFRAVMALPRGGRDAQQ